MPATFLLLKPRFAGDLTRLPFESGAVVSLGLLLVGAVLAVPFGLATAASAVTGAMCVSIADQPGPVRQKPRELGTALLLVTLATLVTGFAKPSPAATAAVVVLLSFFTALLTSYGKRLLGVSFSLILALVLTIGVPQAGVGDVLRHSALVLAGGAIYLAYSIGAALVVDRHQKRIVLADAMRAFAGYLRLKGRMLDPAADPVEVQREIIDRLTLLTERFQAAREMLFPDIHTAEGRRNAAALVIVLDVFELILSSQADDTVLRRQQVAGVLIAFRAVESRMAEVLERLAARLQDPARSREMVALQPLLDAAVAAVAEAERSPALAGPQGDDTRAALRGTLEKLGQATAKLRGLREIARDPRRSAAILANLQLGVFAPPTNYRLGVLRRQLSFEAPVLRYAVRLSLAMLCGYALSLVLPLVGHGNWIMLTVAVTLRANYSATKQRRQDRVVGTLIGCVVAVVLLKLMPPVGLAAVVLVAAGIAHAFVSVRYLVTASAAAVMALLELHLLDPAAAALPIERLVDTLIGAGLALAFTPLLQNWEHRGIPQLVEGLLAADREFCAQALHPNAADQLYRLARKRTLDSHGALVLAARRMLDEPAGRRSDTAALNRLLAANYLLASFLASVHALLAACGSEMDPQDMVTRLAEARGASIAVLGGTHPAEEAIRETTVAGEGVAAALLARRLRAIHEQAQIVAVSAAKLTQPQPVAAAPRRAATL